MTDTTGTAAVVDDAASDEIGVGVWFEACAEHRGAVVDGPCEHCGWLAVDHTAGLAEVIAVPRQAPATPLRRAS